MFLKSNKSLDISINTSSHISIKVILNSLRMWFVSTITISSFNLTTTFLKLLPAVNDLDESDKICFELFTQINEDKNKLLKKIVERKFGDRIEI